MTKDKHDKRHFTRREFIKSTAVGATVVYLAPSLAFGSDTGFNDIKSRVVNVFHPKLITLDDQIHAQSVRQCVDETLLLLTQKKDIKDAWMQIFPDLKEKDTISLKVNCVNRKCPTHPQITYAIAESMINSFGMNPNNIIIWDRTTSELKKTGYTINETDKGIRCFGTVKSFSVPRWLINANQDESDGIGYDKSQPIDVGNGETSHLSKILTQMSTYMINVPVLKDHGKAGITLSLKNHYGTIDNPHDLHANYCDPFVGKINAAPQIKEKTKLIICDAAFGIYKGGPLGAPQWKHNSILASTDPVALDYTGMQIINAQRKKHNLDMVTQKAIHVKTAQTLGLGTSDPDKILLKESVLS
ncbi:MAG: DUF362 domain-containing protein [Desulfobacula sp.]|jgi:uncharacterized protein (DUF362 family)|uniref:DUF362 domain-containing protein n=1 Tax=Desulfobacula sp. TaxID=2593537 RepID=UPI001DE156F7|nr:DUF362 domain-containing protein [Desulfobacula sp.]MBT3486285.1 DUF362 domain-containing protein [Desulfobacula sp.]MBT3805249.1 DUF362 domain-containing protein [Desulfobacula sp.]MBT4026096.1 DUF362 domain-containing protein [Desulfobacula sp.]MBT4198017.1 DUF362 domain-containing protein [Desulfobacula sp.]